MRLGQSLIGNPVISITDGRNLGQVKDLYLDANLRFVVGIYLGSEGLIKRKPNLVRYVDVEVFGIDAVLVQSADVVRKGNEISDLAQWLRLDDLQGRDVDTPGGTKIGKVGDVVLNEQARITGFSLTHISVEGPVAENKAISRMAMTDSGNEDSVMTIDLAQAERENLRVDPGSLFSEPAVVEERE
ncbi:MAG: PRC-barrel domain-containing protein [Chloroflexota bacterium]|nr:PRC-barrel domain-containing protein [Chloroflexota bacterium]